MRRIASGAELWFEKLQGSVRRAIPRAREPDACARRGGARDFGQQAAGHSGMEGADTPMRAHAIDPAGGPAFSSLPVAAVLAAGGIAFAGLGQPSPWQMGFQQSAAPTMDDIIWFHNFVLWIIVAITVFVLALLVIVMVKFNARANPTPSRTTHNTLLEVAWTVIPVVILVVIAIPSFRILFVQLNIPPADLTIKATGNQWNWTYAYPDEKIEFTSIMLTDAERTKLNPPPPRLLAVDNADRRAGEQGGPRAGDRVGRDPRLRGAFVRHQDRRDPGPAQRDLVQGDARGRLLRPVLRTVRQGSRLHADRGARRQRAGLRDLAGGREEEVRA